MNIKITLVNNILHPNIKLAVLTIWGGYRIATNSSVLKIGFASLNKFHRSVMVNAQVMYVRVTNLFHFCPIFNQRELEKYVIKGPVMSAGVDEAKTSVNTILTVYFSVGLLSLSMIMLML